MGECLITRRGGNSKVGTVAGSFYISNKVVQLTPANFTGSDNIGVSPIITFDVYRQG
ncbi:hypothetical protein SDC9_54589 [bioreactor metagenome]|uniref:Uncharacterized protein n=1 Tax=bioreactor metagenome TaxID=1076179 RepID=A0A644WX53_9ZZZZ